MSRYRSSLSSEGPHFDALEPRQLLAADPVTPDNPLWIVPRGGAVIDGQLDEAAWDSAYEVFRTQATRNDRAVTIRMMHDDAGLYLAAEVEDNNLWADGLGGGAGNRWEVESDDSITFFFDPDGSRDNFFQANDIAFGVNIANWSDPVNGSGAVKRWKYVKGDGAGGAPDVLGNGVLAEGMAYATSVRGTVNNPADTDQGWSVEIFLPWAALNMSGPPQHGQTIGMNFDMVQDNDGGARNLTDNRANPDPNIRYLVPHFIDDHVQGSHSSFTSTQAGINGPVNYAAAMFIDARAGQRPAPIADASVANVSAYGARLDFTAPAGTTTGLGHASAYQIRVSTSPITTDAQWLAATPIENSYVPRANGLPEQLRVAPLAPATTYYIGIRAMDGAGNLGDLSNQLSFTTAAAAGPADQGRIIPSPSGNTLMFEDGTPFIAVGDHLGLTWGYTRQLYTGEIWDLANNMYHNFSTHIPVEGHYSDYFDLLQSRGINTMRVYLELQNVYFEGNPNPPNGLNWLENNVGQYNPDMRNFVENILHEAATRGMKLIFSPFDSFSYDEAFGNEGPWATSFGGPLTDINNFFQAPQTLAIAKNRMKTVINWVAQSGNSSALLGWEPLSEWDSYEWTLNPEGNNDPGRETEMRRRAVWIDDLALYIKQQDPNHLVFNSTITRDPRGPLAREIFYSRTFDALTPHLYTNANESPLLNPQSDKSALAAMESGYFTSYFITHRIDNRPILNGEWGMTRVAWPGGIPQYQAGFTQQQDEYLFRSVIWSGFASGQFGTALRIVTEELDWNAYLLTPTMRDTQLAFSNFANSQSLAIDYAHFSFRNLAGRLTTDGAGKSLLAWGVSDGTQGIVYILQDGNRSSGTVSGGTLTIRGLALDRLVDAEVWSTLPGATGPLATLSALYTGTGEITLALPDFTQDIAIKFKARESASQAQKLVAINVGDKVVTFGLDVDDQPYAQIIDSNTGESTTQDVAALANFRGCVVDMTPLTTPDGMVHLALTDDRAHVWILSGDLATGIWNAYDHTAATGNPGMTGDLTSYQPSWGAIHIAGLDVRGHAINYWWAPGLPEFQHTDLTAAFDGPALRGGLTGYVTGWDGLNLAGLNDQGQIVVYWWAPGIEAINSGDPNKWVVQNLTTDLNGPTFVGQLDAYVTPWGGLNVAGVTASGEVWTYWWSPQLKADNLAAGRPDVWELANLTVDGGAPPMAKGVEVAVSGDGGINIFAIDADDDLHLLRWVPGGNWADTNLTATTSGPATDLPLAAGAAGPRLIAAARASGQSRGLVVFSFLIPAQSWTAQTAPLLVAV